MFAMNCMDRRVACMYSLMAKAILLPMRRRYCCHLCECVWWMRARDVRPAHRLPLAWPSQLCDHTITSHAYCWHRRMSSVQSNKSASASAKHMVAVMQARLTHEVHEREAEAALFSAQLFDSERQASDWCVAHQSAGGYCTKILGSPQCLHGLVVQVRGCMMLWRAQVRGAAIDGKHNYAASQRDRAARPAGREHGGMCAGSNGQAESTGD